MSHDLNRRTILLVGAAGLGLSALAAHAKAGAAPGKGDDQLAAALAALEAKSGGKLGVAVLDSKDGALVGHRLDERFTMCSTFKLSLAALVLAKMDRHEFPADASLPIGKDDPVGHSPAVRAALDAGKTSLRILDLAEAAQTQSDNGAANILLRVVGGPAGLTAWWRALGDTATRLDRYEPLLNTSHDGDPMDTSTPGAMGGAMRAMLTGKTLRPASRERLIGWMVATQTGMNRLRGGLPADWKSGDKTGTNMGDGSYAGKVNDLAIVWKPGRPAPFLITAFLETAARGGDTRPDDEAILAEAGRVATDWIKGRL